MRTSGPVDETFEWFRGRMAGVIAEGQARGELDTALNPAETASTIVAGPGHDAVPRAATRHPAPVHPHRSHPVVPRRHPRDRHRSLVAARGEEDGADGAAFLEVGMGLGRLLQ